jgi:protease IV
VNPTHLPYLPEGQRTGKFATIRRWWGKFWRGVDGTRRALFNTLFLLIVGIVLYALLSSDKPAISDKTVLVLDLNGPLVEQAATQNPQDRAFQIAQGEDHAQVRLRDVLRTLDAAAKDPRISSALLMLDNFAGGGLAGSRELAQGLERFKASGKKVLAWGSGYSQRGYYVAAHANEVWMHPMGSVILNGYGRTRNYYKDTFDQLGIQANVIRVGTYKNAMEPYFANAPSQASLESEKYLWDELWGQYTGAVEKARKLGAGAVMQGINAAPELLKVAGGDLAKLSLNGKLVDALKTRDELRAALIERGAKSEDGKTFRQIGWKNYLSSLDPANSGSDAIGIIVAEGEISDGSAPAGRIGGKSTSDLVRKAREDDSIKAIVLRVNSPGGSAFGSELIRRELELTRKTGKPVVISMGNLAASGGYWISMAADEIWADPATITGSIGVFGMLPSASDLLSKTYVKTGGYHTTWLGAGFDPRLPLDDRLRDIVQQSIGHIYKDFTEKAAAARKTTADNIDAVAQGRVWTGTQAKERGLIDQLGGLGEAVASAAKLAKLEAKETPATRYIETDKGSLDRLLDRFGASVGDAFGQTFAASLTNSLRQHLIAPEVIKAALPEVAQDMQWLADIQTRAKSGLPFASVVHCLCDGGDR